MRRYTIHYEQGVWRIWDRTLQAFCGLDGQELTFGSGAEAAGWLIRCAAKQLPGAVDPRWRVFPPLSSPSSSGRWLATRGAEWARTPPTVTADTTEGLAVAMERAEPHRPEPHLS